MADFLQFVQERFDAAAKLASEKDGPLKGASNEEKHNPFQAGVMIYFHLNHSIFVVIV